MTNSQLRTQLNVFLEQIAVELDLRDKKILEVGIAGDEKPSGSFKFFGQGNEWSTMDKNGKWEPDYTQDICSTNFDDEQFDVVIMTQTLEHIWDYKKALREIHRITKEYAIIDSPWMYDFHQDSMRQDVPWWEWDDYHRLSPAGLNKALKEVGFREVDMKLSKLVNIAVSKK